jgi:hypothetical protein
MRITLDGSAGRWIDFRVSSVRYPLLSNCLSVTFAACSRGVLPFVSSHDCSFATVRTWVVVDASTATVNFVPGPADHERETALLKFRERACCGFKQAGRRHG